MSDCPNAEIRDLLPELLHDRLDAPTRAQVLAHVNGCADCRSELELLRSMRGSLHRGTPRVDVNRIVAALPAPARPAQRRRAWRVLNDWRIAAAVTFLVAGGTSMVVLHNARDGGRDSTDTSVIRPAATVATQTTTRVDSPSSIRAPATESASHTATVAPTPNRRLPVTTPPVSRGGTEAVASVSDQSAGLGNSRIDDLNSRQLKSLLNDIDHMDATPITDPEPVTLRVGARMTSPTGL